MPPNDCKVCALHQWGMEGFQGTESNVSPLIRMRGQGNEKQTPTSSRKGLIDQRNVYVKEIGQE